jgi:hypothetical protein
MLGSKKNTTATATTAANPETATAKMPNDGVALFIFGGAIGDSARMFRIPRYASES